MTPSAPAEVINKAHHEQHNPHHPHQQADDEVPVGREDNGAVADHPQSDQICTGKFDEGGGGAAFDVGGLYDGERERAGRGGHVEDVGARLGEGEGEGGDGGGGGSERS